MVRSAGFAWTQTSGPAVTLSNASASQPTFTAPNVDAVGAALEFELQVTDDGDLSSADTVTINVSNVNMAPIANAGSNQTVGEGVQVTLDGSNSSDPDGSIAAFVWTQTSGPAVDVVQCVGSTTYLYGSKRGRCWCRLGV